MEHAYVPTLWVADDTPHTITKADMASSTATTDDVIQCEDTIRFVSTKLVMTPKQYGIYLFNKKRKKK